MPTKNPDMLKRRKFKREFQEMATEDGLQEVILEIAVEQKINTDQDAKDRAEFKTHKKTPVHKAHPWTKETYLIIAGICIAVSTMGGTGAAALMG